MALALHNDIGVLFRLENAVQIATLGVGRHELRMLFRRHIEIAVHLAALAELDIQFIPAWLITNRRNSPGIDRFPSHAARLQLCSLESIETNSKLFALDFM